MVIKKEDVIINGVKFSMKEEGQEVARCFVYLLSNELHDKSVAYLEDVFVRDGYRGRGFGTQIVEEAIKYARENAYKFILGSRFDKKRVHSFYERLGFKKHGIEFRMDLG